MCTYWLKLLLKKEQNKIENKRYYKYKHYLTIYED